MTDSAHLRDLLSEAIIAADPTLAGRLGADVDAHLDLVALTARARTESDALLQHAVASARSAGCTWEAVGTVLDMTRQAAQQRFGTTQDTWTPTAAGRTMRLAPLFGWNEMSVLARAGRYGWHGVHYGIAYHVVQKSEVQWEHERVLAAGPRRRQLEAEGWERFGPGWFPCLYYKRTTGRPAEPEPATDDYLMRLESPLHQPHAQSAPQR